MVERVKLFYIQKEVHTDMQVLEEEHPTPHSLQHTLQTTAYPPTIAGATAGAVRRPDT